VTIILKHNVIESKKPEPIAYDPVSCLRKLFDIKEKITTTAISNINWIAILPLPGFSMAPSLNAWLYVLDPRFLNHLTGLLK
jgi:hypothetical protein